MKSALFEPGGIAVFGFNLRSSIAVNFQNSDLRFKPFGLSPILYAASPLSPLVIARQPTLRSLLLHLSSLFQGAYYGTKVYQFESRKQELLNLALRECSA